MYITGIQPLHFKNGFNAWTGIDSFLLPRRIHSSELKQAEPRYKLLLRTSEGRG